MSPFVYVFVRFIPIFGFTMNIFKNVFSSLFGLTNFVFQRGLLDGTCPIFSVRSPREIYYNYSLLNSFIIPEALKFFFICLNLFFGIQTSPRTRYVDCFVVSNQARFVSLVEPLKYSCTHRHLQSRILNGILPHYEVVTLFFWVAHAPTLISRIPVCNIQDKP